MARLPIPGKDNGTWGDILNDYLSQSLAADGTLKPDSVSASQIQDGAIGESQLNSAMQAKLDVADARLQRTYLDPRELPNGPITALTRGTFHSVFGSSPLVVQNGKIVHDNSGVIGYSGGYLQANVGQQITRIGCVAYWPSGSTGTVALVIPDAPWGYPSNPGITDANIHFTISSSGVMALQRYAEGGTIVEQYQARSKTLSGGSHVIEVVLVHSEQRVVVLVDGERYLNVVDADNFVDLSTYCIWELWEANSSIIPAQLLSVWADGDNPLVPPAAAPAVLGQATRFEQNYSAFNSANGTFTTSGVATWEAVATKPNLTVYWPESKRMLIQCTAWVAVTGGDLLMRAGVAGAGGQRVAKSGFEGRIYFEQIMEGTLFSYGGPVTLSVEAFVTGGSATFTSGGGIGPGVTLTALPIT